MGSCPELRSVSASRTLQTTQERSTMADQATKDHEEIHQIRNFWVEAQVSGQKSKEFGPRGNKGNMNIRIWMKRNGIATRVLTITGVTMGNELVLNIIPHETITTTGSLYLKGAK